MSWQTASDSGLKIAASFPATPRRRPPARSAHRAPDRRAARAPPPGDAHGVQRGTVRRSDLADLAGDELQAAAVERFAERQPRHRRCRTSSAPRSCASSPASRSAVARPAALALAWKTRSHSVGAASGSAKRAPSARASFSRDGAMSTTVTSAPGSPRAQIARPAARPHPPPTIGDPIRRAGRAVPHGVERRLHVGGEHGARRRDVVRQRETRRRPASVNTV